MPKKLLSDILNERSESVNYRKIRKELMNLAQNNRNEFIILKSKMDDYSATRLRNEGIQFAFFSEFGYDKIKLSW